MIVCQLSLSEASPIKISKIADKGIFTDPKLILVIKNKRSKADKRIKCVIYFFLEFN